MLRNKNIHYLERDIIELSLEDRLLASAQRILDKETIEDAGDKALRNHQIPAFNKFADYIMNLATTPDSYDSSQYCRIVLPPRTGKTVIAGKIIALAGLCTTFVVPTKTLVNQTYEALRSQLPQIPIGLYYGGKKCPVNNGVNITTYATLQKHYNHGILPKCICKSALVFLDEAHHSMTDMRVNTIDNAFEDKAIRIALTATPDYNEHRRLQHFFPELIHGLELHDAFELGLLAAARMWVIEVDTDASTVNLIAGDYEQKLLGRLMSGSPFFKAVQDFRYFESNIEIPALITCSSRHQAYDLWLYLKKQKPKNRPNPGLILGETSNRDRERLLSNFECGLVDTLIQVGVLIEGWNAPQCKLLLDLAPSLSRVRATQKYFRVMTRHENKEARIVVILPKHLPRLPILPIDLLLKPGDNYYCGDLLRPSEKYAANERVPIDKISKSPIKSVKVKTRVIASASLIKPSLNPDDPDQIRQVLATNPNFSLNMSFGYHAFCPLFFNHRLFVGTGKALLGYLKIPNKQEAYFAFLVKTFPEKMGNHIIQINGGLKEEKWQSCSTDFQHVFLSVLEPNKNGGKATEPFVSTLNSICGGIMQTPSPEEFLLLKENINLVFNFMKKLDKRQQQIVILRLGLFGNLELTWQNIGEKYNISKERARQIFFHAIRFLRKKITIKQRGLNFAITSVFEYPDIFEIFDHANWNSLQT